MPIKFFNNKILFHSEQIAFNDNCCCDANCIEGCGGSGHGCTSNQPRQILSNLAGLAYNVSVKTAGIGCPAPYCDSYCDFVFNASSYIVDNIDPRYECGPWWLIPCPLISTCSTHSCGSPATDRIFCMWLSIQISIYCQTGVGVIWRADVGASYGSNTPPCSTNMTNCSWNPAVHAIYEYVIPNSLTSMVSCWPTPTLTLTKISGTGNFPDCTGYATGTQLQPTWPNTITISR